MNIMSMTNLSTLLWFRQVISNALAFCLRLRYLANITICDVFFEKGQVCQKYKIEKNARIKIFLKIDSSKKVTSISHYSATNHSGRLGLVEFEKELSRSPKMEMIQFFLRPLKIGNSEIFSLCGMYYIQSVVTVIEIRFISHHLSILSTYSVS